MLSKLKIAVYFGNNTKHINAICVDSVQFSER